MNTLKPYKPFWKRVWCVIVGHIPLEDFAGNVFCFRCNRKGLKEPAKMSAAEYIWGPAGKRLLERERGRSAKSGSDEAKGVKA